MLTFLQTAGKSISQLFSYINNVVMVPQTSFSPKKAQSEQKDLSLAWMKYLNLSFLPFIDFIFTRTSKATLHGNRANLGSQEPGERKMKLLKRVDNDLSQTDGKERSYCSLERFKTYFKLHNFRKHGRNNLRSKFSSDSSQTCAAINSGIGQRCTDERRLTMIAKDRLSALLRKREISV